MDNTNEDALRNAATEPQAPPAAVSDSLQRVEAERMEEPEKQGAFESPSGIHVMYTSLSGAPFDGLPPPIIQTWLCLAAAWFFLGSKAPFTVLIGLPINVAALILAAMCLARGGALTGILVILFGTVGSLAVYLIGLFRFLSMM